MRLGTVISIVLVGLIGAQAAVGGGAVSRAAPYGTWKAKPTREQLLDFGMVDPRIVGTWRLELRKGTYRLYNPLDGWFGPARLTVDGSRLVIGKDPLCGQLVGTVGGRATYRWTITRGKLRLRSITPDPCGGRWQTLTIPLWTRG